MGCGLFAICLRIFGGVISAFVAVVVVVADLSVVVVVGGGGGGTRCYRPSA